MKASGAEVARKVLLYWMDALVVVLGAIYLLMLLGLWDTGRLAGASAVIVAVLLLGQLSLFPLILRAAYDDKPRPTALLIVSGVFMAASLPFIPPGTGSSTWEIVGGIWLSGVAVNVPWRVSVGIGTVVGLCTITISHRVAGMSLPWAIVNEVLTLILTPLAMWCWVWLWHTIREAHESQEAKTRLAVAEERLRFARDLHDLLGHSLSVISLKSELAAKLAAKDAGRAAGEMSQVRELAGDALVEVEAAVEGYRSLDLQQELLGVRAALEAAGARCEIAVSADDLSPSARALLAWVVREGATNILKHSTATRCAIIIDGGVLEMRNDGVTGPRGRSGSGLRGLAERLTTAGGSFSAQATESGEFLLRAAVPA
ncbi:sensor histidine kinase [Nonomuraea typhae]|uniref:Sensor histidine kinase n=1 Tax=Nonomuraea typhae TaxID=2603600 RepID=A0ABW7YKZ4_9ACTN